MQTQKIIDSAGNVIAEIRLLTWEELSLLPDGTELLCYLECVDEFHIEKIFREKKGKEIVDTKGNSVADIYNRYSSDTIHIGYSYYGLNK